MANRDYICESCKRITKYKDLARLPDSGGWTVLACPHCQWTALKRFKVNP